MPRLVFFVAFLHSYLISIRNIIVILQQGYGKPKKPGGGGGTLMQKKNWDALWKV